MQVRRVPPREAKRLIDEEGYTYLDVRSEQEWQAGHAAGSLNVPLAFLQPGRGLVPNPDFVSVCEALFGKDAPLLVGCKSGGRSQRAVQVLQQAGFRNAVDLQGGFGGETDGFGRTVTPGWAAEGLPSTDECPPEHGYEHLSQKR
jgi:rhodanese-related sulfurtransferase